MLSLLNYFSYFKSYFDLCEPIAKNNTFLKLMRINQNTYFNKVFQERLIHQGRLALPTILIAFMMPYFLFLNLFVMHAHAINCIAFAIILLQYRLCTHLTHSFAINLYSCMLRSYYL